MPMISYGMDMLLFCPFSPPPTIVRSPLIVAVEHENIAVIDLLLQQLPKLDVNMHDNASRSALQIALLERHNLEIAEKLLAIDGLDLLCADKKSQLLLSYCMDCLCLIQFKLLFSFQLVKL